MKEERQVQAKELEAEKDRVDELLEEKAKLEHDRQVHATELEAKRNKIEELVEEKTKLEGLLEEERQVQAIELEASKSCMVKEQQQVSIKLAEPFPFCKPFQGFKQSQNSPQTPSFHN